ncbi:MAG: hypothetical protein F6J90_03220 [Moorea sp. SIOASIH]|uniref:hypothetical protein n=1 Tax=Moorena sp. SIOASIH TaxID=2607817 RepID=UPI0013BBAD2E|nr:hypothetical protein [Moorena sp. SIOASIH]NEO35368.1 hypothetical protein [Moorena sp. SIOASIH]
MVTGLANSWNLEHIIINLPCKKNKFVSIQPSAVGRRPRYANSRELKAHAT